MESYKIETLSFAYPGREKKALDGISLTVKQGEFITLCGKSGCGKTTLLRLLKSVLAPYGQTSGSVYFNGKPLEETDSAAQAAQIGFVLQNPDNQIVTDKVWHELAFGLESLGFSTPEIRTRVAEMASFFGIQTWFHKKVTELSGGQKQLLNLASVMVMQPSVLILDEPTSQLDPIAAQEFLKTVEKINRELGTTVLLSEHRLEEAFPMSDRVVVLDEGRVIADAAPEKIGAILKAQKHDMYAALPVPARVVGAVEKDWALCPVTVREGSIWLKNYAQTHTVSETAIPAPVQPPEAETAVEMRDVWFRYEKDLPDVICGLELQVRSGELFAVLGGNGTGKTTALSLIGGLNTPYRGTVKIHGKKIGEIKNLYGGVLGMLPQNPQSVFVKNTVEADLKDMLSSRKLPVEEAEKQVREMAALCRITDVLGAHPYDLSGGEQQRAALAKVLLMRPQILLLDEPTKGLDAYFKQIFADILSDLRANGVTVILVSHDIEFCAAYADRCAMFFDGSITSVDAPRAFFAGKSFYTTAANRMARGVLPTAVLCEDIIRACGGLVEERKRESLPFDLPSGGGKADKPKTVKRSMLTPARAAFGGVFAILFVLCSIAQQNLVPFFSLPLSIAMTVTLWQICTVLTAGFALFCFFPQREIGVSAQAPIEKRKLSKRTLLAAVFTLLAIPLTIYTGVYFLGDRKYYFISLLIILETILPFCTVFESRKPQARELVLISVLCAIGVSGRAAFYMLPQFKPVVALVILVGVCFGAETGFLVGAVTGFVSNFFFGQGPWTPWQMFAFGIIGFLAGILFRKGFLRKTRAALCIFGALSTLVIYGGIMNPASVIMAQNTLNIQMFLTACAAGLPFDLIHAASTVFFLWFLSEPMIEKLERIKLKYGLIER